MKSFGVTALGHYRPSTVVPAFKGLPADGNSGGGGACYSSQADQSGDGAQRNESGADDEKVIALFRVLFALVFFTTGNYSSTSAPLLRVYLHDL